MRSMTHSETITFQSGSETLVGTIDWNANRDKPTVLWMHGSKPGGNRATTFTQKLAQSGPSCFRFDFTGHGDSSGPLPTLYQLENDARNALEILDKTKPLTIIGSSLSGHIALSLLAHANIKNLVLLCPAVFPDRSKHADYHDRRIKLTDNTAKPFAYLHSFTGNLLHIIGEHDTVIPAAVTEAFKSCSTNTKRREFIVIPEMAHSFTPWFEAHPDKKMALFMKMINFITDHA